MLLLIEIWIIHTLTTFFKKKSSLLENSAIAALCGATDGTYDEPAIMDIVHKFTLNKAQERAFRIIAYHTLGRSKVGPQLRMGCLEKEALEKVV